jgi:hypothetical protein
MAENTSSNLGGTQDGEARKKLVGLREALLRLHKTLLDMERRAYEKEHGAVNAGQLFQLVVDNPQFAWLHNISEFVVRIDETLENKEGVTEEETHGMIATAKKLFVPTETGDGFQKKYYDAIQADPTVVMQHAELAKMFLNERADT